MLTTVYTGLEVEQRIRKRPTTTQPRSRPIKQMFGTETVKDLSVPSVTAEYNDHMGGVDIGDQLRASEGLEHRIRQGPWRVLALEFLLETSLVNSYLLQLWAQNPNWNRITTQNTWRRQIVQAIWETYTKEGKSRQRFNSGDINTPLSQHKHVDRKKRSLCLACKGFKAGQTRSRSQLKRKRQALGEIDGNIAPPKLKKTKYGCDACDVAICTGEKCWYLYHSDVV